MSKKGNSYASGPGNQPRDLTKNATEPSHTLAIQTAEKESGRMTESERLFRLISDNTTDGFSIFEGNRVTYISEGFLKLLGYERKEADSIDQDGVLSFMHMDDVQRIAGELMANHKSRAPKARYTYRIRTKTGKYIWVEDNASSEFDTEGNHVRTIYHTRDITERKMAEEALERQLAAMSMLNRFYVELSMLPQEDNLELLINRHIKEISGAEMSLFSSYNAATKTMTARHLECEPGLLNTVFKMIGKQLSKFNRVISDELYNEMTTTIVGYFETLYDATFGALPRSVSAAVETMISADRFIGIAYMLDGKLYGTSLLSMGTGNPDPPKQILEHFSLTAAAAIRKRKADDALRESEKHNRELADSITDIFFELDSELKYMYWNKASENFLEIPAGQALGKYFGELFPDTLEMRKAQDVFREVIRTGNPRIFVTTYEIKGSRAFLEIRLYPTSSGVAVFATNITDLKTAELQIKAKTEELVKLNAEKDKFYSVLSHDLRSPFQSLLGFSRMMVDEQQDLSPEDIAQIAGSMNSSIKNLYNLLDNLLEWSRFQRGLMGFDPETFHLLPAVEECMKPVMESALVKNITLNIHIPSDIQVFADQNMIGSAIRNLGSNAVKFTNRGGKINVSAKPAEGDLVMVSLDDDGVGMSKDLLDRLFHLDMETSRRGTEGEPSTGLGLIICRDFIEKNGGDLNVISKEGKGSTFYFSLPAHPPINL